MNAQEIFDTVAKHLIAQGRPAAQIDEDGVHCLYRAEDGAKCAFGVLIPNDCYDPKMEGVGAARLIPAPSNSGYACLAPFTPHKLLIGQLQTAHDEWANIYGEHAPGNMGDLKRRLASTARQFNLDVSVLEGM